MGYIIVGIVVIFIFFWIFGRVFDWWHWKFSKHCPHKHPRVMNRVFRAYEWTTDFTERE